MHENEDYLVNVEDFEDNYDDDEEEIGLKSNKRAKLDNSIEIISENGTGSNTSSALINDIELELLGEIDYIDDLDDFCFQTNIKEL
jgi:hypothetical protein